MLLDDVWFGWELSEKKKAKSKTGSTSEVQLEGFHTPTSLDSAQVAQQLSAGSAEKSHSFPNSQLPLWKRQQHTSARSPNKSGTSTWAGRWRECFRSGSTDEVWKVETKSKRQKRRRRDKQMFIVLPTRPSRSLCWQLKQLVVTQVFLLVGRTSCHLVCHAELKLI